MISVCGGALSRGGRRSWGWTERRLRWSWRGYYFSSPLCAYTCRSRQGAGHLVGTVCTRCRWDIITDGKVTHLCLHWRFPRRRVEDIELRAFPTVLMGRRGRGWLREQHSVLGVAAREMVKATVCRERGTAWWRRVVYGRCWSWGWMLLEEAVVWGVFGGGGGRGGRAVRGEVVVQVRLWGGRLRTLSMGSEKKWFKDIHPRD